MILEISILLHSQVEPPSPTDQVPNHANHNAEPLQGVPLKPDYSPQFHVAVLYNSVPVAMEKVKNKHGCRIFTGMLVPALNEGY